MRPTAHTQQASSRAVATFALLPWTPRASSASRLSTSLRTPLAACLRAPRSGAWPLARSFGHTRARQVVPRGLDQRLPQVLVAGLGDRAPAVALPAGVLGGRQADPRGERAGVPEPGELAGLEHEVGGGRGVDALEAAQGVDPPPPPGLAGLGPDEPLEPRLLLRRPPDRLDVVGERVVVGPLREPYRLDPGPVRPGPVPLPVDWLH